METITDSKINVAGFAILRNGIKYAFPFKESLLSLHGLCGQVQLALGDNQDETAAALQDFAWLRVTPTVWDPGLREGGLVLSQQTNIALQAARKENVSGWGFYLHCDEAIHEQDYPRILNDLRLAEEQGCDCVSFRYLHFWKSPRRRAWSKRGYPQ
jgi:hypothetical protein